MTSTLKIKTQKTLTLSKQKIIQNPIIKTTPLTPIKPKDLPTVSLTYIQCQILEVSMVRTAIL